MEKHELISKATERLIHNLEELIGVYRHMLESVRKEKELLISANHEALDQNNHHKDDLILKMRLADVLRVKHAEELCELLGLDKSQARLLVIAQHLMGSQADMLRNQHATLELLISHLTEINKENQKYAESALGLVNGAIENIKETVSGKSTYEKKGHYKAGPHLAGNFVSKEV